ncbi:hypothetical protein CcaverHIS002_0407590 [Cutaneotrichosporon cavernicola]|uniref:Uncharacterized protein n=1 Tax=Cutaneotrichosporon cavernicola TaxID=279322 RepID=A0AA48QW21_9TREE|nr:uncharacterized protein CcaverHIS019_0407580 [Cutaneotrichosporon cavernicola]BEI84155.1 hypothetical protein CcaverHIS002_0407590 [Cutaneotrichosporon cavernicola]BEI91938.1 hypothetical protein CcaverHIS019_0407580 [Cutaneotrichosporon cavernicola]BEI99709.1 hypothetical protein CcaverHIS631_0407520 [Cutaneotrichosporon cavernicola]BEJ07484.1 hypothetical protein CcaverHIS641_0407530 [Cutaneotrichosporon cavernicola]
MVVSLALLTVLLPLGAAVDCSPYTNTISCSSKGVDVCCVPAAGRFVFRQRFEPDAGDNGSWGIEGLDVLECDGSPATRAGGKLTHEAIGSLCARTKGFDVEENEAAWAQSEVGEGVEEVWERVWNTAGRYVTSLCDEDADVPRFFDTLLGLHNRMKVGEALEHAGIVTSADTTYRLEDIESALTPFGQPILLCEERTLTRVLWTLHARGNLAGWTTADHGTLHTTCPSEGIVYPPSTVPLPTSTTWDQIYRPTMRPITLSYDENKRVKYDDEPKQKKLGFFKDHDARRAGGDHGHDKYRDEL